MAAAFDYLFRFADKDGNIAYGNISEEKPPESLVGTRVSLLSGDPYKGLSPTNKSAVVSKVLCPLESTPIFQCIGVNYAKHAREANFSLPSQPVVFPKPADAIAGPSDDIYCHPDARSQLDYEGELCFVFGRDCKDVQEDHALENVLGYTIGNDISARNYIPQEVSGGQMGYGKSFDGFAPLGPYLVSKGVVGDPHNLQLVTKVNGEVRQNENTSDMVWSVKQIIAHLTRGRTVRAGTVCMTGTPSGVGWFMRPEGFVRDGDVMEVSIEKVGLVEEQDRVLKGPNFDASPPKVMEFVVEQIRAAPDVFKESHGPSIELQRQLLTLDYDMKTKTEVYVKEASGCALIKARQARTAPANHSAAFAVNVVRL